jgi:hypothetical protein
MKTTYITGEDPNMHTQVLEAGERCLARLQSCRNSYMTLLVRYSRLKRQRDRLLVLATKHCPKTHHDWKEVLEIAKL